MSWKIIVLTDNEVYVTWLALKIKNTLSVVIVQGNYKTDTVDELIKTTNPSIVCLKIAYHMKMNANNNR